MTSLKKVKVLRLLFVFIIVVTISFYAVNNYRLIIQVFNDKETTAEYLNIAMESKAITHVYKDSLDSTVDTLKIVIDANDSLTKVTSFQSAKIKHLSHEVFILSDSLRVVSRKYGRGDLQPVD